jgi:hypothetical protein
VGVDDVGRGTPGEQDRAAFASALEAGVSERRAPVVREVIRLGAAVPQKVLDASPVRCSKDIGGLRRDNVANTMTDSPPLKYVLRRTLRIYKGRATLRCSRPRAAACLTDLFYGDMLISRPISEVATARSGDSSRIAESADESLRAAATARVHGVSSSPDASKAAA